MAAKILSLQINLPRVDLAKPFVDTRAYVQFESCDDTMPLYRRQGDAHVTVTAAEMEVLVSRAAAAAREADARDLERDAVIQPSPMVGE